METAVPGADAIGIHRFQIREGFSAGNSRRQQQPQKAARRVEERFRPARRETGA